MLAHLKSACYCSSSLTVRPLSCNCISLRAGSTASPDETLFVLKPIVISSIFPPLKILSVPTPPPWRRERPICAVCWTHIPEDGHLLILALLALLAFLFFPTHPESTSCFFLESFEITNEILPLGLFQKVPSLQTPLQEGSEGAMGSAFWKH